jgi:hypothetical protein
MMPKRARATFETPPEPSTSTHEGRQNLQHRVTPTKAAVLGIIRYNLEHDISCFKQDVLDTFGVKRRDGYRILCGNPRRHHNDPFIKERRGRPSKVLKEDISRTDQILRDYGIDGRVLTWEQLVEEAGIEDVYRRTIQIHMDSLDYRKCLACKKGWMSQKAAAHRGEYARTKLSLHPEEDY